MRKLKLINLLFNLAIALFVAVVTTPAVGATLFIIGTGSQILFKNSFNTSGMVMFALQTEVWTADIKDLLYANNEFIKASTNHNAFVSDLKVHVPQSGSIPAVAKNRTTLPATISQRTDTDLDYSLDEYTTDPILVKHTEAVQVSYNKRQSVMAQHINKINDRIARETAFNWSAPAAKVVETTGILSAFQPAGSTGTRKKVTIADMAELSRIARNDDFSFDGWNILFTHDMYSELLSDSSNRALNRDFMNNGGLPTGAVDKIHGFNIFLRSSVVNYDVSLDPIAVGVAGSAGDSFGLIAWHKDAVAMATGSIEVFGEQKKPEYYGDVISASVLHGSSKLRSDNAGIVALVQGTI